MGTDDELPTPATPSRAGSNLDLARRMDRMEGRQDTMETKVSDLAAVVARVELNQKHAEELNVLRFNSLDAAVKNIDQSLERFMGRINAIVSGEVKLPQQIGYEQFLSDTKIWRAGIEGELDLLKSQNVRQTGINLGVGETFGKGKAIVITAAAVITATVTVLSALHII